MPIRRKSIDTGVEFEISILFASCFNKRNNILKYLLLNHRDSFDLNTQFTDRRLTALYAIAATKNVTGANHLLEAGANPSIKSLNQAQNSASTALEVATEHGFEEMAKTLTKKPSPMMRPADYGIPTGHYGRY